MEYYFNLLHTRAIETSAQTKLSYITCLTNERTKDPRASALLAYFNGAPYLEQCRSTADGMRREDRERAQKVNDARVALANEAAKLESGIFGRSPIERKAAALKEAKRLHPEIAQVLANAGAQPPIISPAVQFVGPQLIQKLGLRDLTDYGLVRNVLSAANYFTGTIVPGMVWEAAVRYTMMKKSCSRNDAIAFLVKSQPEFSARFGAGDGSPETIAKIQADVAKKNFAALNGAASSSDYPDSFTAAASDTVVANAAEMRPAPPRAFSAQDAGCLGLSNNNDPWECWAAFQANGGSTDAGSAVANRDKIRATLTGYTMARQSLSPDDAAAAVAAKHPALVS